MFFKKKRNKFKLKHLCLEMSRAFRSDVAIQKFYSDSISSEFIVDTITGTLVRKVAYISLEQFIYDHNLMDGTKNEFEHLTIKDKRVLAVFLRKLQDRYTMFDVYLKMNNVSEEYRLNNEEQLLASFLYEAYARKAMNRLFYYCWYKSRECFKDYENYKNHPSK